MYLGSGTVSILLYTLLSIVDISSMSYLLLIRVHLTKTPKLPSFMQIPYDFDEICNVICAADMYLLAGLKRLCTNAMIKVLDVSNVVEAVRMSKTFSMPRLECECCRYIAEYVDEVRTEF